MTEGRLGLADAEHEVGLLMRIIETISAGLDLDAVAQRVAVVITEMTATDVCFVHLIDDSGRHLELRGATPPFERVVRRIELSVGEGVAGWVAAHREPVVIVQDKFADPRYKYIPELRGEDFTSLVSVPIITRLGALVGVLNVHTRLRREFTEADVQLLRSIAGLIAGAMDNARLHRRLAEREEALERFTERMVRMQELDRRRLAGEIHDGIGQRIVSLSFYLSAAADLVGTNATLAGEQIDKAQQLAAAALDEVSAAMTGLRPSVLDDLGLAASLESLAHASPELDVDVQVCTEALPEHLETALYRIAQESLQNVVKHASAQNVEIRLKVSSGTVLLEVSDDGVGFDPASVPESESPGSGGYGLSGMLQRAELLGGRLEVDSAPGRGSTLRVRVPLRLKR
ncbi:GAF domain-containing sensor histidine kinase [Pseudonocardia alaniniphila]|uniref:Oxygen sensor histidine kinase NreB n=1 Tax=Pseudonocardia alaniniphila TaxID=75291 RepID=A0ABS9TT09_9PSEU|nr:GAF domain-containing sensor histidine kinase [Pseudonocardia alaniniphila]MCH6171503.1 GAF domain-containing sensor histidine kinase [Pseudonocardia alaniniphila]